MYKYNKSFFFKYLYDLMMNIKYLFSVILGAYVYTDISNSFSASNPVL